MILRLCVSEAFGVVLPRIPRIALRINLGGLDSGAAPVLADEAWEHALENRRDPPFMMDNGILKAAPKKKLSHSKHRMKLYAPGNKQIKELNNIVRCPACGSVKRSHFMCMHCFHEIKTFLKALKRENGLLPPKESPQSNLDPIDERIIYPGKFESDHDRQLREKKWIPKREEPLMYSRDQRTHKK